MARKKNYLLLNKYKIDGYVKHNQFDREQHAKNIDWFKGDQLEYDKKKDVLSLPYR